jgi:serine/threonine protein kinase
VNIFKNSKVSIKSDIWSLGAVLVEMLTMKRTQANLNRARKF